MSKRLHSVFFIIFPEIACNFGEKYLNLHHIFKIGNIFFRKVMYLCRQIKIYASVLPVVVRLFLCLQNNIL